MGLRRNFEKYKKIFFEKFNLENNIHAFWWSPNRGDGMENYGDILNPFLIEKLTSRKIIHINLNELKNNLYKKKKFNYFVIGSILQFSNSNSRIWGSGIIISNEEVNASKFFAVRGPRTRKRLIEQGKKCPAIYGDPALLLPIFLSDNVKKKYEIGIIPHYVDYDYVTSTFGNNENIKIINLLTNDIESKTKEILSCKRIISSSLHGVIVPHAYGIPAIWVQFSNKLSGDNVKFFDYFESVDIIYNEIYNIDTFKFDLFEVNDFFTINMPIVLPSKSILKKRKLELIKSCPFIDSKIKREKIKFLKNDE